MFTGLQSDDMGMGQTGVLIGEILGMSTATLAVETEISEKTIKIKRELESGWFQWVSLPIPASVSIQSGLNVPRYPSLKGIMGAKKKEIKPVNIGGVVVSNASLHNEDEIKRKDIRIGDTIQIQRAGDVIPQVVTVDISKRDKRSKKYIFPKKCLCGADTKKELSKSTNKQDAVRRCFKGYDSKFIAKEKLKHIVSKEAFNIDGLGKKVIEQFWDLNLIKEPSDIFGLELSLIHI